MDKTRDQLKTMNQQFDFSRKHKTTLKNNLIALLDQTFPKTNAFSPVLFEKMAARNGGLILSPLFST